MTDARYHDLAARALMLTLVVTMLAACGSGGGGGRAPRATPPGITQPAAAAAEGRTVTVVAREMTFTLDTTTIAAGAVTFVLRNEGQAPHDFAIRGNGIDQRTRVIGRGETATLTVTLPPGVYAYECTVGGHATMGMRGTLTVTG
jgi:plastocyanin